MKQIVGHKIKPIVKIALLGIHCNIFSMNTEKKEYIFNILKNEKNLTTLNQELYSHINTEAKQNQQINIIEALYKKNLTILNQESFSHINTETKQNQQINPIEASKERIGLLEFINLKLMESLKNNNVLLNIYEETKKLNLTQKEDFEKLAIIINGLHNGNVDRVIKPFYKHNLDFKEFINNFDDSLSKLNQDTKAILKKNVEDISHKIIDKYDLKKLGEGSYGTVYGSDKLKNYVLKLSHKYPLNNQTESYVFDEFKSIYKEKNVRTVEYINPKHIDQEKLNQLRYREVRHFFNLMDFHHNNSCSQILNVNNYFSILERINLVTFKELYDSLIQNKNSCFTKEQSKFFILLYIKLFYLLNDITYSLKQINYISCFTFDEGWYNVGIDLYYNVVKIDNDYFSFSEEYSGLIIKEYFINKFYKNFDSSFKTGVMLKYINHLSYYYDPICYKYFKFYDVDFLHSLFTGKYQKTLMYDYIEIITDGESYLKNKGNIYDFDFINIKLKLIKFINLLQIIADNDNFKKKVDKNKPISLYSIYKTDNQIKYGDFLKYFPNSSYNYKVNILQQNNTIYKHKSYTNLLAPLESKAINIFGELTKDKYLNSFFNKFIPYNLLSAYKSSKIVLNNEDKNTYDFLFGKNRKQLELKDFFNSLEYKNIKNIDDSIHDFTKKYVDDFSKNSYLKMVVNNIIKNKNKEEIDKYYEKEFEKINGIKDVKNFCESIYIFFYYPAFNFDIEYYNEKISRISHETVSIDFLNLCFNYKLIELLKKNYDNIISKYNNLKQIYLLE